MEFDVRVRPKSGRNGIEVERDRVTVRVTAPPEAGRANDAVVRLLARRHGIARRSVRIVRGHRGQEKRLRVEGMAVREVFARLSQPE